MSLNVRTILFLFAGCCSFACRETLPYQPAPTFQEGYALSGRVTGANGLAVSGAAVRLDYGLDPTYLPRMDTVQVIVPNPPKLVRVEAFDNAGNYVKQIYLGIPTAGPFNRTWNET